MRSIGLKRLGLPLRITVERIKNAFSDLLEMLFFPHLYFILSKIELNFYKFQSFQIQISVVNVLCREYWSNFKLSTLAIA